MPSDSRGAPSDPPGPPHGGQPVAIAGRPLGESAVAMIMVHGRGASPQDILALVPAFDRPQYTYLAPAAAGNAWYPHSFLADMENNEPGLSSGLAVIGGLVDELVRGGMRRECVLILGFSQGGCLASEFAARNAARYGGLVVYSGGLIGPPGTERNYDGAFNGTPVFLGCSDEDAHVPKNRVDETEVVFENMGARVTKRIYRGMGHLVNEDEIAQTRDLMDAVLDEAGEG